MVDFIPSSVRADGSIRKERRVRPGYVPQDEIPAYVPPARRAGPGRSGRRENSTAVPRDDRTPSRDEVVNIKSFSVIPLISSSPASNDVNLDTLRKELAEIVRLQEDLQQRRADVEAKIAKLDNESRSIVAESKLTTMGDKGNNLKTTPVSGHMRVAAGDSSCESSGSAVMEKLASRLGDLDIVPPDDP